MIGIRMFIVALGIGAVGTAAAARARWDRVRIPAGKFIQGSTRGDEDERPVRTRALGAYAIDRTEVTRADYALCVAAGRCKPVAPPAPPDGGNAADRLPVTNVSWDEAQAFCRFAGGRLPSEAEWEKAARGTDGREYPWGEDVSCDRANWGNFEGEGPCAGQNPGRPVAVGQYPRGASPYGVLDLGGNVWEWVADVYDEDPTASARAAGRHRGRAADATAAEARRVVRGGSCCSFFVGPRAANRNGWAPGHRDGDLGFRCAADR